MKKKGIIAMGILLLFFYSPKLRAQGSSPIQIAVFNPLQIVNENTTIKGLRLNLIYGKNRGVNGLDIGFINHTGRRHSTAVQFGFVGYAESDFTGLQLNLGNWTDGKFTGLQAGIVNYAVNMSGVQFGFVNYAETMNGLQIGLANIIKKDGAFPFFPIVNWSF